MDAEARQRVLRQLTYGLYVITTRAGEQYAAGTVNWVTQVSFEPPLIVAGMKSGSGIAALTEQTGRFAVNVLGLGQKSMAAAFFSPTSVSGDRINDLPFRSGVDGLPILKDVPGAFTCQVEEFVRCGDHLIVVGRVTEVYAQSGIPPLTLASTGWYYGG